MIVAILEHTPTWVWILFCAVMALGIAQTRARDVGRARATVLPAVMMVLSLRGVLSAFGLVPLALAAWVAGLVVSLAIAGQAVAVKGASWSPEARRFRIPGSWLPVTLILGVFVTKYIAGVCFAIDPSLATNTAVAAPLSLTYGVFAGLFLARARSLRALTRAPRDAQLA